MNNNSYQFNGNNYYQSNSHNFQPLPYNGSYSSPNYSHGTNTYFNSFADNGINYVPRQSFDGVEPYPEAYIASSQRPYTTSNYLNGYYSHSSGFTNIPQFIIGDIPFGTAYNTTIQNLEGTSNKTDTSIRSIEKCSEQKVDVLDQSQRIGLPSSNEIYIQHPEIFITRGKGKSSSVKLSNFYFLIPRYDHKIRRWKRNLKLHRFMNVVENPLDHALINAVDENSSQSNLPLDVATNEEHEKCIEDQMPELFEISSLSMFECDIDVINSIAKRRNQKKARPMFERSNQPSIVIRIMTHKRIMCHSIRGRQKRKRKRKYLNFPIW